MRVPPPRVACLHPPSEREPPGCLVNEGDYAKGDQERGQIADGVLPLPQRQDGGQ